jgi:CheY-like chemotaxis protein
MGGQTVIVAYERFEQSPPVKNSFPAESRSSRKTKGPAEILMVEDSATDAELARRTLQRAGIANPLTVLPSGEQALAYLFGTGAYANRGPTQPLFILLDLQLPGMSGLDFLSQIKADERTMDIPVVTLSMTKSAPAIVMCLQRGVVDHLIKPVDGAALVRLAKRLGLNLAKLPRQAGLVRRKPAEDQMVTRS